MSEQKFTSGPWEVQDPMDKETGLWIVQSGLETYEWACIASVHASDLEDRKVEKNPITYRTQEANARLIAAAPEMLAALETLVAALPEDGEWAHFLDIKAAAIAALAKAKGIPKFENVSCSQCGRSFGPGDHGFSHCKNHKGRRHV